MPKTAYKAFITILGLSIIVALFSISEGQAQTRSVGDIKDDIASKNVEIERLNKEIAEYESVLRSTQKEAQTLDKALRELDATRKKLTSQIKLTEQKISAVNLNIEKTLIEIKNKENGIDGQLLGIGESMQQIYAESQGTLIEKILESESLSSSLDAVTNLENLQAQILIKIGELRLIKSNLENEKEELDAQRVELKKLTGRLSEEKQLADQNRTETSRLLNETKNKESNYANLLADKQKRKESFEQDLFALESQLKKIIDPGSYPDPKKGVLAWPVDNVYVTQSFGQTEFATKNSYIYNGKGHNGIDLRASMGTPIKSAETGVVLGTGDTDVGCKGASYGKWVMIKHDNGLTSVYAHLSLVKTEAGVRVARGQVIAYSGNSGYSIGPHLHFSILAAEGVEVGKLPSKACIDYVYTIPIAPFNAYLNPLNYL